AERAQELKGAAAEQAQSAKVSAAARAADLREQAEDVKQQAAKDAKRNRKAARKQVKATSKRARKHADKAGSEVQDLRDTFVDEVLPKVATTASGLAAAGVAAGRKAADEAASRAPEVVAALRDEQDPKLALAAAKGEKPRKKRRGLKLLLLALVAGGIAAFVAKQKQGPKKDPWAVPAGDPYKAPATGRDSSLATGTSAAATTAAAAPAAAAGVAPAAEVVDEAPVAAPLADVDVDDEGADSIDSEETLEDTRAEGDDAWSSARDWADNSAVPSVTDTSEGSDVTPHNLGGDLPVEGDTTA
ncbi:hypothetical protein AB4028_05345, partial [Janibacter sp. RAF20_2_2]